MKKWIFKLIYFPLGFILCAANVGILTLLVREVGFEQPYRWLLIIMLIAIGADWYVNKEAGNGN